MKTLPIFAVLWALSLSARANLFVDPVNGKDIAEFEAYGHSEKQ